MMRALVIVIAMLALGWPLGAFADEITPSDRVSSVLRVRELPNGDAEIIETLAPGERALLIGDAPGYYQIRLGDGRTGYVAKGWAFVIATTPSPEPDDDTRAETRFTIHIVDVATGLAIIVQGPDFVLLYDGGSNDDLQRGEIRNADGEIVTRNRLWAYLRTATPEITNFNALILSHPHRDHVELLDDVFAHYDIDEVFNSGRMNAICGYRRFIESIEQEPGVTYHDALGGGDSVEIPFPAGCGADAHTYSLARGDRIVDGERRALGAHAAMTFLHADGAHHPSENENSLVMRLDLGGDPDGTGATRILFMGDAEGGPRNSWNDGMPIGGSVEDALLADASALASDILIVGHHGSRTSSRRSFLDATGAELFIISSGPKRYASVTLPDDIVIRELEQRGAVWRTDISDRTCGRDTDKIGPDSDNRAGGCDNIRIHIADDGHYRAEYYRPVD